MFSSGDEHGQCVFRKSNLSVISFSDQSLIMTNLVGFVISHLFRNFAERAVG
jgi:hypothetical protein